MSAEVFTHSSSCPLCGSTAKTGMARLNGRLVCPYCQTSLVISHSGQFVRDPFHREPLISIQQLRRQSRPFARLLRDIQPCLRLAVGGIALLTIGGLAVSSLARPISDLTNPTDAKIEQTQ